MTEYQDTAQSSHAEIIVRYVQTIRGSGHFLPYIDYTIIDQWLNAAQSVDDVFLVLDDVLPPYFAKHQDKSVPPSLETIHKKVLKKLRLLAARKTAR